ncbi:MAG: hypothetical protein QOI71_1373 [Gaiellales bacterium]|nr:hypothetical protein [Gaiellales bacterium]
MIRVVSEILVGGGMLGGLGGWLMTRWLDRRYRDRSSQP